MVADACSVSPGIHHNNVVLCRDLYFLTIRKCSIVNLSQVVVTMVRIMSKLLHIDHFRPFV